MSTSLAFVQNIIGADGLIILLMLALLATPVLIPLAIVLLVTALQRVLVPDEKVDLV